VRPLGVTGPLSLDVVEGGAPRIGGGAWHAGRALAALQVDATIVASCGMREERRFRAELETLGVAYELHAGGTTTAFSLSYDDEGNRTMTVEAIAPPFAPDVEVEWLQVAPLLRGDTIVPRAPHVLLDGQALVRRPRLGPLRLDADFDPAILRGVSILKLSEEEAALVGTVDVPELIVTHGVRGATVNGTHIPADPVDADPTGAGDMFGAGYLAARASGAEPVDAGRRASALVSALLSNSLLLGKTCP
jgi:sugar/nucleoside kinase (ribokinase family)